MAIICVSISSSSQKSHSISSLDFSSLKAGNRWRTPAATCKNSKEHISLGRTSGCFRVEVVKCDEQVRKYDERKRFHCPRRNALLLPVLLLVRPGGGGKFRWHPAAKTAVAMLRIIDSPYCPLGMMRCNVWSLGPSPVSCFWATYQLMMPDSLPNNRG